MHIEFPKTADSSFLEPTYFCPLISRKYQFVRVDSSFYQLVILSQLKKKKLENPSDLDFSAERLPYFSFPTQQDLYNPSKMFYAFGFSIFIPFWAI